MRIVGGMPTFRCTSDAPRSMASCRMPFRSTLFPPSLRRSSASFCVALRPRLVRRLGQRRLDRFLQGEPVLVAHPGLDLLRHLGMVLQIVFGVLPALADALALEGVPCAALFDDATFGSEIDDLSDP